MMIMSLLRTKYGIAGLLLVVLLVANIIVHIWANWGLVTVKVRDVAIGQVIRSIERQGSVSIYSNIDPQMKISMYVDHVPLPEALETLAVNADAQWRLAFFVAPTPAQVKQEIKAFTDGSERDGDAAIFSFPTPLAMLGGDDVMPVADPRKQTWPGLTAPAAPPAPPSGPSADSAPGDAPPPEAAPSSIQGFLRAFAREADVWIMAPASWDNPASAPPPGGSIASAIRKFVGTYHGSVTRAFILRGREARIAGEGRPRGGGGGFRGDMGEMEDRMRNAISGLPVALQPAALDRLQQELQAQKEIRNAPPQQRRQLWMQHMIDRRLDADDSFRRSPEKRAQVYARLVSNRAAATGKQ